MAIKVVLIDFAGVYFTNGSRIATKKLAKILKKPKRDLDYVFRKGPHVIDYLKGKLSKEQFWAIVKKDLDITDNDIPKIRGVWRSSYTPIRGMPKLVKRLRKNYRVIAFSGNIKERIAYLNKKYDLDGKFDGQFYSFECGFSKPDEGFYRCAIKKLKLNPKECLFIDDMPKFIRLGKRFGFKTLRFKNVFQLKKDLVKIGIRI